MNDRLLLGEGYIKTISGDELINK